MVCVSPCAGRGRARARNSGGRAHVNILACVRAPSEIPVQQKVTKRERERERESIKGRGRRCAWLIRFGRALVCGFEPRRWECDPALGARDLWVAVRVLGPDLARAVQPEPEEGCVPQHAREVQRPHVGWTRRRRGRRGRRGRRRGRCGWPGRVRWCGWPAVPAGHDPRL